MYYIRLFLIDLVSVTLCSVLVTVLTRYCIKRTDFRKAAFLLRRNDVTTVTSTFFSSGILSTYCYIGQFYVHLYKSLKKKIDPLFDWNNSNICRQCILKEKKSFIVKQTETSCDKNNFLLYHQKIFIPYILCKMTTCMTSGGHR